MQVSSRHTQSKLYLHACVPVESAQRSTVTRPVLPVIIVIPPQLKPLSFCLDFPIMPEGSSPEETSYRLKGVERICVRGEEKGTYPYTRTFPDHRPDPPSPPDLSHLEASALQQTVGARLSVSAFGRFTFEAPGRMCLSADSCNQSSGIT